MSEKKVNARVLNKHDTRTNWEKATGFIPKAGEIIIYDKDLANGDDSGYPKFKVGNGTDIVSDLPFAAGDFPMEKGAGTGAVQQETCTASGNQTFAVGQGTTASNNWAYAEGFGSQATGAVAHAEGQGTEASAIRAHAEGYSSKATGDTSHAEGWITVASGKYSHTEGENTEATGQSSHAEGRDTHAQGGCSHAEGDQTYAVSNFCHAEGFGAIAGKASGLTIGGSNDLTVGIYSHAEGNGTYAEGNSSHAEGCKTKALGRGSHAEGWETVATESGTFSHVEGHSSQAQGNVSHAQGWGTIASGICAHSEGRSTSAEGEFSHAGGLGTKATAQAQTAIGKYNAEEATALFIVGNGTADDTRSNLFSVGTDADGNYVKIGDKKVATKDDIPNLNGVEFKEGEMDIPLEIRNGAYGDEAIPYNINAKSSISINTNFTNGILDNDTAWKYRNIISYLDYDPLTPNEEYTDILTIGTEPASQIDTESMAINKVHINGKNIILTPEFQISDAGWFNDPTPAMEITGTTEPVINTYGKLYYNGSEVATKQDIDTKFGSLTTGTTTDGENYIKVGSTTITETQLQNLLSLLNNIYDGSVSFLITFKIDDVEYQAEEGMTWSEWCDSEYNTDGYYISVAMNNQVCAEGLFPVWADDAYSTGVYEADTIIENHRYYVD